MGKRFLAGVCLLAFTVSYSGVADAARKVRIHHSSACADSTEVSAIQASAIQQELMDAALGCGPDALAKFNTFQTVYGPELRRSDAAMLKMFKRVYGMSKGDAQYNAYKTRAAGNAEVRRVRGMQDFCKGADLVFAAALATDKPALSDFVSGIQVTEETPVSTCEISVANTLVGLPVGINIVPTPKPVDL